MAVAKWKYALFLWAVMQSSNRSTTASGFSSSIRWLMPCRVFQTVFAGDVATALLNTVLPDRDVAVAPGRTSLGRLSCRRFARFQLR